jgi:hypothetical protein
LLIELTIDSIVSIYFYCCEMSAVNVRSLEKSFIDGTVV